MAVDVGFVEGITAATTPTGLGDFEDAPLVILAHDADVRMPRIALHVHGSQPVLGGLVGDVAVAGLFDGDARELLAGVSGRGGACVHDRVHLGLGKFGESLLRLMRALDGGAGFLDGNEIGVVQTQKAKPRLPCERIISLCQSANRPAKSARRAHAAAG